MTKKKHVGGLEDFLKQEGVKDDVDLVTLLRVIGDEVKRRGLVGGLESPTEGQEEAWRHAAGWAVHADEALTTAHRASDESKAGDYALISIAASLRELCALQRAK